MLDNKSAQAKGNAGQAEKEPFDYGKFAKLYLHDTGNCESLTGNESEAVQKQFERGYYAHPEFVTIEEFADFLNRIDETS